MRPTKEMILETKELVNKSEKTIKQRIKENDLELNTIRNKYKKKKDNKAKYIFWLVVIISLLASYPIYRFFFSK